MKHILIGLILLSVCSAATARDLPGDKRILAARDALRTGDRVTLERLAAVSDPRHPLDHYVEYWLLLNKLARPEPAPRADIEAWIASQPDGVPANRLRAQWLRRMAKDGDWSGYLSVFADHPEQDEELQCLAWQARLALGDAGVLDEAAQVFATLVNSHLACDPVFEAAVQQRKVAEDDAWWRFRRQVNSRQPEAARRTLQWLNVDTRPFGGVLSKPEAYFDRLPTDFARSRAGSELALAALVRLAREDVPPAHVRFLRRFEDFSLEQRVWMYTVLGHMGALSRLPLTNEWYAAAGDAPMSAVQRAWRVRAALRAEDWPLVERSIDRLHASEQTETEWVYWRARARAAQGDGAAAERLYRQIAGGHGFYSMLAAEELGRRFALPGQRDAVSPADKSRAAADPGLRAALTFYRLGLDTEGVREWIHALRGKPRDFIIAAAHVALDHGLLDRAINTAELADAGTNFEIRFLTPFRELIEPQALKQQVDLAWIYGLMRQESRFNIPARSGAGARGLMQVMPETGRLVARQIGMKGYKPQMLNDPQTNVLLGTSYMRMILDNLDQHPVLASTGYNAGPNRAQRWRGERPIEGAIYIATIPIDETRDYVQKVLVNKVIYAALLEGRPQSLRERLGIIPPALVTEP
ncbi:MAG: lytic transglycosylase domain-containing protein [Pseudazoarcus pumilus]|nr:lytic transglycosylase domain-containing protein [Pseudazoarcus pumilus]